MKKRCNTWAQFGKDKGINGQPMCTLRKRLSVLYNVGFVYSWQIPSTFHRCCLSEKAYSTTMILAWRVMIIRLPSFNHTSRHLKQQWNFITEIWMKWDGWPCSSRLISWEAIPRKRNQGEASAPKDTCRAHHPLLNWYI